MNKRPYHEVLSAAAADSLSRNTNLWPNISARLERKPLIMKLRTHPLAVILLVLFILLVLSGVVYALGISFGYFPGIGLVENNSGIRVLAEPASVTREGITLTVTQALVYDDHVQLVYEVSGIAPENDSNFASDAHTSPTAFCGGVSVGDPPNKEGDPILRLPDGTRIERMDGYDERYPENIFTTKPVYIASIPSKVTDLTLLFKCIRDARLGTAPENWEIPLKLKFVPEGTTFGEPVLEVSRSSTSTASDNGITVSLEKVVPQDNYYSFFISVVSDKKDGLPTRLFPDSGYLIDSTGQKITLNPYVYPPSIVEEHDPAEPWELQTMSKPGYGPYTLIIDSISRNSGHWEVQWESPDQTGVDMLDSAQAVFSSGMVAELERVVKLGDGYLFFIHMTAPEQRSDLRVIEPVDVSVVDVVGHKIKLNLDAPQLYNARPENLWQFSTKEQIADGPITILVEKAKVYYSNFNFDGPPADDILQRTIQEHSFTFDVGANPQVDQTWTLNQGFEVGGYKGKVVSVRAVTVDSRLLPFPELQPDASINRGYEFSIESVDPAIQWNVNMFLDKPQGAGIADCIGGMDGDVGLITTHTVSCRGLPNNTLRGIINEISVLVDDTWEIRWGLPTR